MGGPRTAARLKSRTPPPRHLPVLLAASEPLHSSPVPSSPPGGPCPLLTPLFPPPRHPGTPSSGPAPHPVPLNDEVDAVSLLQDPLQLGDPVGAGALKGDLVRDAHDLHSLRVASNLPVGDGDHVVQAQGFRWKTTARLSTDGSGGTCGAPGPRAPGPSPASSPAPSRPCSSMSLPLGNCPQAPIPLSDSQSRWAYEAPCDRDAITADMRPLLSPLSSPWSLQPPCCFPNRPDTHLSQGLCTCFSGY